MALASRGDPAAPEELPASCLGTREYWDSFYEREISNFSSHGDEGEVWFGEHVMTREVSYLAARNSSSKYGMRVLDIGCGNGAFLWAMAEAGFTHHLCGIDYSENSTRLATAIAASKADAELSAVDTVDLRVGDILSESCLADETFDIVHDKGTYDAVCLAESAPRDRALYLAKIPKLLSRDGIFLITSCNWTADEIQSQFLASDLLELVARIAYPTFRFGGTEGSTVVSLVFRLKSS